LRAPIIRKNEHAENRIFLGARIDSPRTTQPEAWVLSKVVKKPKIIQAIKTLNPVVSFISRFNRMYLETQNRQNPSISKNVEVSKSGIMRYWVVLNS
jgi:hypothetical protein